MDSTRDRPIFIAHITAPQESGTGDFRHRVGAPDAALGALPGIRVVSATNISRHRRRLFEEADVLVLQMMADPDLLCVVWERRRLGLPTVFEISDNFMSFQDGNPMRGFYEDAENRSVIAQLARRCDGLQFSSHELARRFGHLNGNHAVFENQLEEPGPAEKPDGLVVGWGGSAGHLGDVAEIAPAVCGWLRETPGASLAIMGDRAAFDLFGEVPEGRKRFVPAGDMAAYFRFLESIHIGLAPMGEDDFNVCRSDGKFIEYASRGVVALCGNLPPYRNVADGATGFLYDTPERLAECLRRLAGDVGLRRRIAAGAHEYAGTRLHSIHAGEREAFYRKLAGGIAGRREALPEWPLGLPEARIGDGGGHVALEFGEAERALYDGLIMMSRLGDPAGAAVEFRKAAKLAPEFDRARYYLGMALGRREEGERAMREAGALAGWGASHHAWLGECRRDRGDAEGAVREWREAQGRNPLWAGGWCGEAMVYAGAGDFSEAAATLRAGLEVQADHAPSLGSLGAALLRMGEYEEAGRCFLESVSMCPREGRFHSGLAAALLSMESGESEDSERVAGALRVDLADASLRGPLREAGKRLYGAERIETARALFGKLLDADAADAESLFWLARIAERQGEAGEAEGRWRRLAALEPGGRFGRIAERKLKGEKA